MAQAPKCRNFPSCGKRHYGDCGTVQEPRDKRARPEKKSKPALHPAAIGALDALAGKDEQPARSRFAIQKLALSGGNAAGMELLEEILARVESLEARVLELESRKKYMREYQRTRRAEERGDG